MSTDFLRKKLDERLSSGNLRKLSLKVGMVDFVSNDYLGLAGNMQLKKRISESFENSNFGNGGTGSRLLSGNQSIYEETEEFLAQVFHGESALLFNSGYAANQALVSSVADRGDTILYDQLSHVCLKEGAWLSKATTIGFKHNDLDDLRQRLSRCEGRVFVLTESIFSMDGDFAPLTEIIEICEEFGALLIVDEAHSTGIYGDLGSGYLVHQNLHERVFARVYTFGKAMGVHGACVVGPQILKEFLVNFGRPFIYTTSLPPHSILSIRNSFDYLGTHSELQNLIHKRISYFRSCWAESISTTAVQPVIIGSSERAKSISQTLQKEGFDVRPILSPTVKKGSERLRICLHVQNSEDEILALTEKLRELST